MRKILNCRRSMIALFSILCLTVLGVVQGIDVSFAIAGIVASIAGANSYQGAAERKYSSINKKVIAESLNGPQSGAES